MITLIITAIATLALITFVICLTFYPCGFLAWFPSVIIAYAIISTCTVIIPPATETPPGHYTGHSDGYHGYITRGDATHILPPGFEGLKWPWEKLELYNHNYASLEITIPCSTNDGMRLNYIISAPSATVRFDPLLYQTLYNHNTTNYQLVASAAVKPTLDRLMQGVSEADFELGNVDWDTIESTTTAYVPQDGLDWKDGPTYYTHFSYIDTPKYNYACEGVGAGYCAAGDAMGLPKSPNRYRG